MALASAEPGLAEARVSISDKASSPGLWRRYDLGHHASPIMSIANYQSIMMPEFD
jgi:hypothetical protein